MKVGLTVKVGLTAQGVHRREREGRSEVHRRERGRGSGAVSPTEDVTQ